MELVFLWIHPYLWVNLTHQYTLYSLFSSVIPLGVILTYDIRGKICNALELLKYAREYIIFSKTPRAAWASSFF